MRNSIFRVIAGLTVAAVSLYLSWVFWFAAHSQFILWLWGPRDLWSFIQWVNENGAWKLRGEVVTGGMLWAIWIAEAVIVCLMVVGIVRTGLPPFCEKCSRWTEPTECELAYPLSWSDRVEQSILEGRSDQLVGLAEPAIDDEEFDVFNCLALSLCHCPTCSETCLVMVHNRVIAVDHEGNLSITLNLIGGPYYVDGEVYQELANYEFPEEEDDEPAEDDPEEPLMDFSQS